MAAYQPSSPVSGPHRPTPPPGVGRSAYAMPGMGGGALGAGARRLPGMGGGGANGPVPGNRPPLTNGYNGGGGGKPPPVNGVNILPGGGFKSAGARQNTSYGAPSRAANGHQRPPPTGSNNVGHRSQNSASISTSRSMAMGGKPPPPQNYAGHARQPSYGRSPPGPQGNSSYRPPPGIRLDRPTPGVGGGGGPGSPQTMPIRRRIPPPPNHGRRTSATAAGHHPVPGGMPGGGGGRHSFNAGAHRPATAGGRPVPLQSQTMRTLPMPTPTGRGDQPRAPSKILPTPQQTELMIDYLLEKLSTKFKGKKKDAVRQFEWWFFERQHAPFSDDQVKLLYLGDDRFTVGLIAACGLGSWKSFSLKKVACLSMRMLDRMLDEAHVEHKVFRQVFLELPVGEYRRMKFVKHLTGAGALRSSSRVVTILKNARPELPLECYSYLLSDSDADVDSPMSSISSHPMKEGDVNPHISKRLERNLSSRPKPDELAQRGILSPKKTKFHAIQRLLAAFLQRRPAKEEMASRKIIKQSLVFGVPLDKVCENAGVTDDGVPLFLDECCRFLRRKGVFKVGLFRVSGCASDVISMKQRLDYGVKEWHLDANAKAHDVAALVKLFFREMPSPVIPFEKYETLVNLYRAKQQPKLEEEIRSIPKSGQAILHYLLKFLGTIAHYEERNKMSAMNLAIVFAPNLMRMREERFIDIARDTPVTIGIVNYLIEQTWRRVDVAQIEREIEDIEPSVMDVIEEKQTVELYGFAKSPLPPAAVGGGAHSPHEPVKIEMVRMASNGILPGHESRVLIPINQTEYDRYEGPTTPRIDENRSMDKFSYTGGLLTPGRKEDEDITDIEDDEDDLSDDQLSVKPDPLPEPWQEYRDPETGLPYYFNPETQASQWTRPNQPRDASDISPDDLAEGWGEFVDPDSNVPYFYNESTGESSWDRPTIGELEARKLREREASFQRKQAAAVHKLAQKTHQTYNVPHVTRPTPGPKRTGIPSKRSSLTLTVAPRGNSISSNSSGSGGSGGGGSGNSSPRKMPPRSSLDGRKPPSNLPRGNSSVSSATSPTNGRRSISSPKGGDFDNGGARSSNKSTSRFPFHHKNPSSPQHSQQPPVHSRKSSNSDSSIRPGRVHHRPHSNSAAANPNPSASSASASSSPPRKVPPPPSASRRTSNASKALFDGSNKRKPPPFGGQGGMLRKGNPNPSSASHIPSPTSLARLANEDAAAIERPTDKPLLRLSVSSAPRRSIALAHKSPVRPAGTPPHTRQTSSAYNNNSTSHPPAYARSASSNSKHRPSSPGYPPPPNHSHSTSSSSSSSSSAQQQPDLRSPSQILRDGGPAPRFLRSSTSSASSVAPADDPYSTSQRSIRSPSQQYRSSHAPSVASTRPTSPTSASPPWLHGDTSPRASRSKNVDIRSSRAQNFDGKSHLQTAMKNSQHNDIRPSPRTSRANFVAASKAVVAATSGSAASSRVASTSTASSSSNRQRIRLSMSAAPKSASASADSMNGSKFKGRWRKRLCGGNYPDYFTWWQNPQYHLRVARCTTTMSLTLSLPPHASASADSAPTIGITVIQVPGNKVAEGRYLEINPETDVVLYSTHMQVDSQGRRFGTNGETVTQQVQFQPDHFYSVKCVFNDELGEYVESDGPRVALDYLDLVVVMSCEQEERTEEFQFEVTCPGDKVFTCTPIEDGDKSSPGWFNDAIRGAWSAEESTAGGCYPNYTTWRDNPQFQVFVLGESVDPTRLLVHLERGTPHVDDDDGGGGDDEDQEYDTPMGFYVFRNTGPSSQKLCVDQVDIVKCSEFVNSKTNSATLSLDPFSSDEMEAFDCHYTIMPCTFTPGQEDEFTLTLFSEREVALRDVSVAERWEPTSCWGAWTADTAGGCRNYDTWDRNPQFVLTLGDTKPQAKLPGAIGGQNKALVVLSQNSTDLSQMMAIGFYVVDHRTGEMTGKGAFMLSPEVFCEIDLNRSSGPFVIVPCTFKAGLLGEFTMKVFSQRDASLVECR